MKTLTIEWKHLDRDGTTCDRCADTGRTLRKAVRELNRNCRRCSVRFRLKETRLTGKRIVESNAIHIGGRPLESLLRGVKARETACGSCSELLGKPTSCRALRKGGRDLEAVPSKWIRQAACRAAGCECPAHGACGC
jgi:hypothetical protein